MPQLPFIFQELIHQERFGEPTAWIGRSMEAMLTNVADDPDCCPSLAFGLTRQTLDLTPLLGASLLSSSSSASV